MGAFEFVAIDKSGKESKGLLEGDTPKHVRQTLRERQLLPISVTEVARKESRRQGSFSLRRGLSASELALMTRQLANGGRQGSLETEHKTTKIRLILVNLPNPGLVPSDLKPRKIDFIH